MCAKGISISYIHAGLLTVIRKRLQGKKFTSSIHFNHYFWLTGEFQKYQTKVANLAPRLGRMLSASEGLRPLDPLGLCPQNPVIG